MTESELRQKFIQAIGTYENELTAGIAERCVTIAKEYAQSPSPELEEIKDKFCKWVYDAFGSPRLSGPEEQKIFDFFKPYIKSDAPDFITWVKDNMYERYWGSDGPNNGKFYKYPGKPGERTFYTPKELYELFKRSVI